MRRFLWVTVAAVCCSCSSSPPPDPADVHFLDALHRADVTYNKPNGEPATDADMVEDGKDICTRVRENAPNYDPVLVLMLAHSHTDMSHEQAQTVVRAAEENYCPALLH